MFSFANPEFLYLLLLLPVVGGIYAISRYRRRRAVKRFGRLEVVERLMPDVSRYKHGIRLGLELALIAAIAVMLARPRYGTGKTSGKKGVVEVAISVDVSNSMNASATNDPSGVSRLQQAKLVLERLIDKIDGNKVSLVVFAGKAYMQMPMTGDAQSAKMFLSNISTDMVDVQGTAIGSAIEMCSRSFSPDTKSAKAIVLITDGENFEDDAADAAKRAAKNGIQVNVLGVGSGEGMPIPLPAGGYLTDDEGHQAVTKLDVENAKEISKAGKGEFVEADAPDAASSIADALDKLASGASSIVQYTSHNEQFTIFAWIALVLLLADVLLLDRANSWLSKFNFFTRENDETVTQ